MDKISLFNSLKNRGLFWSYDKRASLDCVGEGNFIETCLRYGDWPDLLALFALFEREQLLSVWQQRLRPDMRFKKQNLLIARVLFGLNVEASFLTEGDYDRASKLRNLIA